MLLLLANIACKRAAITKHEYMYVSAAETSLRDRVATMYNKVGSVHNGERVEVLERAKRFLRVRTDRGVEGWIEQRSLVTQDVFDGFQKLGQDATSTAVQGHGTTRAELNMHLTPARDGEHLYQLKEGEKVEILKRATTDKNAPKPPPPPKAGTPAKQQPASNDQKPAPANTVAAAPPNQAVPNPAAPPKTPDKSKEAEPPKPAFEDWYLVRNSGGQVGWVLMRMVDLDVPLDIAQYAEGQRIVGYFVLNMVNETIDGQEKQEPQYLVLMNQPKDGLPYDYNQVRVFTRNRNKHRYETAYREHGLDGVLPVTVTQEAFDKEGTLPVFILRVQDDARNVSERKYKLNTPIVRRVLAPGEVATRPSRKRR